MENHRDTNTHTRITSPVSDVCIYKHVYGYRVLRTQKHTFSCLIVALKKSVCTHNNKLLRLIRINLTCSVTPSLTEPTCRATWLTADPSSDLIYPDLFITTTATRWGNGCRRNLLLLFSTAHKAIDPSLAPCVSTDAEAQTQIYASWYATQSYAIDYFR